MNGVQLERARQHGVERWLRRGYRPRGGGHRRGVVIQRRAGAFALAGLFAFAALPVALAVTRSAVSSVRRESRREPDPSVP